MCESQKDIQSTLEFPLIMLHLPEMCCSALEVLSHVNNNSLEQELSSSLPCSMKSRI